MKDVLKADVVHIPLSQSQPPGHVQFNFITCALLFTLLDLLSKKTSVVGATWGCRSSSGWGVPAFPEHTEGPALFSASVCVCARALRAASWAASLAWFPLALGSLGYRAGLEQNLLLC